MKRALFAALIGGALVYFFDPENGQKRRDQAVDWLNNMMQQSPDRFEGIRQATQDQWQGLSNNVSQRVSQFRTSPTNTTGTTGTNGITSPTSTTQI